MRGYLEKGTVYVGRLIIQPEFQNKGVGTKLMNAIEHHFKIVHRFELFTGHESARNLHLYQKLGYREFKRISVNETLVLVYLEKLSNNKELTK